MGNSVTVLMSTYVMFWEDLAHRGRQIVIRRRRLGLIAALSMVAMALALLVAGPASAATGDFILKLDPGLRAAAGKL